MTVLITRRPGYQPLDRPLRPYELVHIRKNLLMSHEELGCLLGVEAVTVIGWEHGRRPITLAHSQVLHKIDDQQRQ